MLLTFVVRTQLIFVTFLKSADLLSTTTVDKDFVVQDHFSGRMFWRMETSKPEIYRHGGAQKANVIPLKNISVSEFHISVSGFTNITMWRVK